MDKKPISIIHTPCKLCVFAEYVDSTQEGCTLGYLEKYKKNNIEILEAYDNEKNFYIINNKKCLGYRDSKWLEKNKNKNPISVVEEEGRVKYITIIELGKNILIESVKKYISSLLKQKILPIGILFYKNRLERDHLIDNKDLLEYMSSLSSYNIQWKIQNFVDKDMKDNDRLHSAIHACPMNRFYLLADLNNLLPERCLEDIQNYIDNGNSFGCINIDNNKFFSYISVQYCKNIKHLDLLSDTSLQTKYETIS